MTLARAILLVWAVAAAAACGGKLEQRKQAARADANADLRRRAAFDLRCAEGELKVTPLNETDGFATTVGVDGCGQRVTYVYSDQGNWILNSVESVRQAAASQPAAKEQQP